MTWENPITETATIKGRTEETRSDERDVTQDDAVFNEGDTVEVMMPSGWVRGTVKKVMPEYAWTGRTHYEITGKEMLTIAPARVMRRVD